MSVKVMSWVFAESQARGSARMVLLSIADRANDEGADAFPSEKLLALKAGISERTVRRCLDDLVALGELHVEDRPGLTNYYTVIMQPRLPMVPASAPPPPARRPEIQPETPAKMSGVSDGHPGQNVRGINSTLDTVGHPTPDTGVHPPRPLLAANTSGTSNSQVHTHRAREADPADRADVPPLLSAPIASGPHRSHATCGRVCVPAFLHDEFRRNLGGDEADTDADLRAWYLATLNDLPDAAMISDPLRFWRDEFKARLAAETPPCAAPANRWTPRQPSGDGQLEAFTDALLLEGLNRHQVVTWFGSASVRVSEDTVQVVVGASFEERIIRERYHAELGRACARVWPGRVVSVMCVDAVAGESDPAAVNA